ncbi:unnamed protein product [Cunninghamella blakesleeana]
MGISGLWDILGPAEKKYTLEELALGHIDCFNCNLRVAIDISIWNFQAQSSQGGRNAALRTIFYRCCKLYNLGIKAIFVFDGNQRPAYKRKRKINTTLVNSTEHHFLVAMLKMFKFVVWQASGEAEAECAILQKLGFVDLIMTTDVDVFLFGAQRVVRNFPTSNEPAICIDSQWIKDTTILDRSDLILMGLISGSDYFSGIHRIGIQLAYSLARSKHHVKFMDALLEQTKNNTAPFPNDHIDDYHQHYHQHELDEVDPSILILLEDMLNGLQSELLTNHSGFLQRRYTSITFEEIKNSTAKQLINLTKDWIQPTTAIMDKRYLSRAKVLNHWVYQQSTPDFKSLACFCQMNFDWPKDVIISKFGRMLFPGYMLQRTIQQTKSPIQHSLIINHSYNQKVDHYYQTQQNRQQRRQHPYFNKYYKKKDNNNKNDNNNNNNDGDDGDDDIINEPQTIDLICIHSIENKTSNKINNQHKYSKARVEWSLNVMNEFLDKSIVELTDQMDDESNNDKPLNNSQYTNAQNNEKRGIYNELKNNTNKTHIDNDEEDEEDEIDLGIAAETSGISPYSKVKPTEIEPPLSALLDFSPLLNKNTKKTHVSFKKNEINLPFAHSTPFSSQIDSQIDSQIENQENYYTIHFDKKKSCKQWISYQLLQRAYPKIVDKYMKNYESKKYKQNKKSKGKRSVSVLENQSTLNQFISNVKTKKNNDQYKNSLFLHHHNNNGKHHVNENKMANIGAAFNTSIATKAFILISDDDDDDNDDTTNIHNTNIVNDNDNDVQKNSINVNNSSQKSIEDYFIIPLKRSKINE